MSHRLHRSRVCSAQILTGLALLVTPLATALAQDTGFNKTSGANAYTDPANWVNGDINGIWDRSLTLTNDLTPSFSSDYTLLTGLTIEYTGGRDLYFRADGSGPYTVTLGGDILVNMTSTRKVTFGSSSPNQALNVDLGGTTRAFHVVGTKDVWRSLIFSNEISNGGFVATGGGKVSLDHSANTLTSVTVGGVDLVINGAANSSVDTVDTITNALVIAPGTAEEVGLASSTISLTTAAGHNTTLQADHFVRNAGGAVLFRGTNLGGAAFGSADTANVRFTGTAPTLSGTGAAGTSTVGIIAGAYGDSSATGTGFGATGGLVTYDAATGVRLLTASEYANSITSGQTQLDNVRLANSSGSASIVTLNDDTTVNSLSLITSGAANSGITIGGTGTLTLNSGVIYANSIAPASGATSAMVINNTIDLNGQEGIVLFNTAGVSNSVGGANLQLMGVISNDGGKGLTLNGAGAIEISGTAANTFTGKTTLNGGFLRLHKTGDGLNAAIIGDLEVNGGSVFWRTSHQIADTASITVNEGSVTLRDSSSTGSSFSETFNNLTVNGGEFWTGSSGSGSNSVNMNNATLNDGLFNVNRNNRVTVSGLMSLSGTAMTINRSQSTSSAVDTTLTLTGGLSISNTARKAYTPIMFTAGTSATNMGGRILLTSDLTFTGNATNANTVLIDAEEGSFGNTGFIALEGDRTFNIGDGAAGSDLTFTAPLADADPGTTTGGIIKTGLGTLDLRGANTYTGATVINAGTFLLNGSGTSAITVNNTGRLGGAGVSTQSVTINDGGILAPGDSTGALSTGDLTFAGAGATLALDIGGTAPGSYSQISVTGGVNLNGNGGIELTLQSFTPEINDLFFVILNDGSDVIEGTFLGLAQGDTFSAAGQVWQISYTGNFETGEFTGGNDLALIVAIPEPQTWLLLGTSMLALCLYRRRKVRA